MARYAILIVKPVFRQRSTCATQCLSRIGTDYVYLLLSGLMKTAANPRPTNLGLRLGLRLTITRAYIMQIKPSACALQHVLNIV